MAYVERGAMDGDERTGGVNMDREESGPCEKAGCGYTCEQAVGRRVGRWTDGR